MLHLSCSCSSVGFLPQVPALHELLQGGSFPGVTCDPCRSCDLCQQTCASMGSSPWAVCGLQPPSGLALLWHRLSTGCRVDESRCLHHGSPWAEGGQLTFFCSSPQAARILCSNTQTTSSFFILVSTELFLSFSPHSSLRAVPQVFYPFLQQL